MTSNETKDATLSYPFEPPAALDAPPEWAELRAGCPVAHVRTPTGDDALLLTRYEDVKALLSDPRFTRRGVRGDDGEGQDDAYGKGSASGAMGATPSFMADNAEHLRWRRLLSRSFTAKRMTALEPRIAGIAGDLITEMEKAGPPVNLRTAFGFPLPVYVICELLGVPASDREKFADWSDHFLNLTRFSADEVRESGEQMWAYMVEHVRLKREQPGDDLLSELAAVVDAQDGRLSETELVFTAQGLLVAGHETTANMIGKMVAMLLAKRERWEQLLADRGLIRPAVEEALRFDANLGFGMHRYITERIEIAGTVVEPGTTVLSSMPSANRDERHFACPDQMDLTRSPNPHITFGAGPHSCLGQSLARVELQTVLRILLDRLPGLELAVAPEELRRREGLLVGGLEEVPVRW